MYGDTICGTLDGFEYDVCDVGRFGFIKPEDFDFANGRSVFN